MNKYSSLSLLLLFILFATSLISGEITRVQHISTGYETDIHTNDRGETSSHTYNSGGSRTHDEVVKLYVKDGFRIISNNPDYHPKRIEKPEIDIPRNNSGNGGGAGPKGLDNLPPNADKH